MRSADEFNEVRQAHSRRHQRLRHRSADRHTAADSARLALPSASPIKSPGRLRGVRRCPQFRDFARSAIFVSPRHVSRRRLHLADAPRLASPRRAGREVPGDHRTLSRGNRHAHARSARKRHAAPEELRPGGAVLQALAVSVATAWAWQKAREADRTRTLATGTRRPGHRGVRPCPASLRRLPGVANDRGVASVRYHFSNMSEDIIGLFTAALDKLGIPWTRSSKKTVSIYRKAATARLDEFIGPKTRAVPLEGVHYTA